MMNTGRTIFAQLMDLIPKYEFRKCVERYNGNYKIQTFSCWDQFLCMAFAQLTYRESLRDIEACLRAQNTKLYHMGIRSKVSRNTLANANSQRDWRIYRDLTLILISTARRLYQNEPFSLQLKNSIYALDSTIIDLSLTLFPWAKRQGSIKGAVKLHTLLDLKTQIPTMIVITDGRFHDVRILEKLPIEPGAIYVFDRGYTDFAAFFRLEKGRAFFVTRARRNLNFQRRYSHPVDKSAGLLCDQTITLKRFQPKKDYPEPMRRIRYRDPQNGRGYIFLTNHFELPAQTIADLYRCRWQIELFFKWIKQHLRIKSFFGTSVNAVKTQIWIAVATYTLVAIFKKHAKLEQSLYTILQVLSVSLFEKGPILEAFARNDYKNLKEPVPTQLTLFD